VAEVALAFAGLRLFLDIAKSDVPSLFAARWQVTITNITNVFGACD
jgi:hypothetical protein